VLWCYPEFQGIRDKISLHEKAILCVFNEDVAEVNKIAINLVDGYVRQYYSAYELDLTTAKKSVKIPQLNTCIRWR
jgi:hypothetical protein